MTPREMAVQAVCENCRGQGGLNLVERYHDNLMHEIDATVISLWMPCKHCDGIGLVFPRAAAPDGGGA